MTFSDPTGPCQAQRPSSEDSPGGSSTSSASSVPRARRDARVHRARRRLPPRRARRRPGEDPVPQGGAWVPQNLSELGEIYGLW